MSIHHHQIAFFAVPCRAALFLLLWFAGSLVAYAHVDHPDADTTAMVIGPEAPVDLEGGAFNASLRQASLFAWSQFIALNWSAVQQDGAHGTRGTPYRGEDVPQDKPRAPRVWETYRAKTELFPGIGEPHGFEQGPVVDYGYDNAPLYRYDPAAVGIYPGMELGLVPACSSDQSSNAPPWIELSERHEVGPEQMYSGVSPVDGAEDSASSQRVMYAVKVDRKFYRYVAANAWLEGGNPGSRIPAKATRDYLIRKLRSPPSGSTNLVSFPNQSIQIKTAWRRLSEQEQSSGRFFTAVARSYYRQDSAKVYAGREGNPNYPCYVDARWGLIGMHIKAKTASAPYYIWSTFEQVDNVTNEQGMAVEDENGRLIGKADLPPTEPHITSRNATAADPASPSSIQRLSPLSANARPAGRLYYKNKTGTPTPQGTIAINRRFHAIPEPVVAVNQYAHRAIRHHLEHHRGQGFIDDWLMYYKLVSTQWKPADKPVPGQDLVANPAEPNEVLRYPSVYYMANIVLETSYRLQNYSGTVQSHLAAPYQDLEVQDLITDFDLHGKPVKNVIYDARIPDGKIPGFNMGGCMGCHGQIQLRGYDFSFIFRRGRIAAPEMDVSIRVPVQDMVHPQTPTD